MNLQHERILALMYRCSTPLGMGGRSRKSGRLLRRLPTISLNRLPRVNTAAENFAVMDKIEPFI